LSRLFSNTRTEVASAEIHILKGRAEFSLPDSDQWTPAYSEQEFLTGDSIRTNSNTRISFDLLEGNVVFLDQNSELVFETLEEKSSGKKVVSLKLLRGKIWARVSDDDFREDSNSSFLIKTPRSIVHVRGTVFDLSTYENQDTIRLIKGGVDVDVFFDETKEHAQTFSVGVGQKLVISPPNIDRMKRGEDVLEIVDTEFIESEWHLQNLEQFYPQEVSQIRRRIEIIAPQNNVSSADDSVLEVSDDLAKPEIFSPQSGIRIPASTDTIKIEGSAPPKAVQIIVNGYTLTRFQPGDRKWAYFAAQKFGTLVPGENTYSVIAIGRDGKKSAPAEISIFYEGAGILSDQNEDSPILETSIDQFEAPVITNPAILSLNEPYQTSGDVVTISGIVDPKTNAVEVNGFRLQKFEPGQTEFRYIANARYGNMHEGENVYEVVAFGPDGKKSSTIVKVVYTPLNVEN
jgi:hypothetical protein